MMLAEESFMPGALDPMRGEEILNAPPAKVFAQVSDLDALAQMIPDLHSSEKVDARTLKCVVRPGFSFIRGTMKLTIALTDITPETSMKMLVKCSGIGLTMDIESMLELSPLENGARTKLAWQTQVMNRTGLISLVGSSLIQGAAEKTIRDGWGKLKARVES
jgi:carbon monoxide dehydrogenase subunit G